MNLYKINNSGCGGAYCYNNQTWQFKTIEEAVKGAEWLENNHEWRTFPYYIVEIYSGEIALEIRQD